MSRPQLLPDDPRHGTASAYTNNACRCDACRAAGTAAARDQRRRRIQRGLSADDRRHGTYNAYNNFGCRCAACRAANVAHARRFAGTRR